jgi:hypothetical protein
MDIVIRALLMVPPRPLANRSDPQDPSAERESISLRTKDGKAIEVVVLSKRPERIHVILGEGTHSVFCELKPTADARAYVGNAMGRELVYERSRAQVEADVAKRAPRAGDSNF